MLASTIVVSRNVRAESATFFVLLRVQVGRPRGFRHVVLRGDINIAVHNNLETATSVSFTALHIFKLSYYEEIKNDQNSPDKIYRS